MRIRFHKILAEGRSVRYERNPEEEEVLDLSLIVFNRSSREKARPRRD